VVEVFCGFVTFIKNVLRFQENKNPLLRGIKGLLQNRVRLSGFPQFQNRRYPRRPLDDLT